MAHRTSDRIAIVGAGLTGLTAARALTIAGLPVRVFDKGRGPGGRMSSRRVPFAFDHGAQYFTVRDARFRSTVEDWVREGVAQAWSFRLGVARGGSVEARASDVERYVGTPRMSAITRHLAAGLDLQTRTRVGRMERRDGAWQLWAEDESDLGSFDTVLLTLPPAQAANLLALPAPDLAATVRAVEMRPCWAVLVAFDERIAVPYDGLFVHDASLSWVARNTSKPERPEAECWVLHGSPEWSAAHLELEPNEVRAQLLQAFFDVLGLALVSPEYATAHRWRYALAADPLDTGYFFDGGLSLGVGGDWCHGSRVEGAFLSGLALAQRVTTQHD